MYRRTLCLGLVLLLLSPHVCAGAQAETSWLDHMDEEYYQSLSESYADAYWTPDTALQIRSEEELAAFAAFTADPSHDFADRYLSLEQDLDLRAHQWEPIAPPEMEIVDGVGSYRGGGFRGTFEGNGHTISGICIDRPGDSILGLFGAIRYGTVRDLAVDGSIAGHWNLGGIAGQNYYGDIVGCVSSVELRSTGLCVGGIAGQSNGSIRSCDYRGTNSGDQVTGGNIGGIVGWCGIGTVRDCRNFGEIAGNYRVGGVVGRLDRAGSVAGCENRGRVKGVVSVGGITGETTSDTESVRRCYNVGAVTCMEAGRYNASGGIAGRNVGSISLCRNDGPVLAGGHETRAGGIAGFNGGEISDCYNAGDISSQNAAGYCGGIVGYHYLEDGIARLGRCANRGAVSNAEYAGGIAGFVTSCGRIDDCHNSGVVHDADIAGGIAGYSNGQLLNCYQYGQTQGRRASSGITGGLDSAGGLAENCYYDPSPTDTNAIGEALDRSRPLAEQLIGFELEDVWSVGEAFEGSGGVSLQGLEKAELYLAGSAENILEIAAPRTEYDLIGGRYTGSSRGETGLGDLTADALLWYADTFLADGTSAAVINGGAIRQDLYKGPIDVETMEKIFPFGDTLVVLSVTGEQLRASLEDAVQSMPRDTPSFPQVAGMEYTLYIDRPADGTRRRVKIGSIGGKAFSPTEVYQIVTISYLADGGDGYDQFDQASRSVVSDVTIGQAVVSFAGAEGDTLPERYRLPQGRVRSGSKEAFLTVPEDMLLQDGAACLLAAYDTGGRMVSVQRVTDRQVPLADLPRTAVRYRFFCLDGQFCPQTDAASGEL